jgi:L-fuconolactonase
MRVDAHQHFWHYSAEDYDWIDDSMQVLRRDFLPADLAPLLAANGIDVSVAVQARQTEEETAWLLELADSNDIIAGVVGWTDLMAPGLDDRLTHYASHPKLKGFRHVLQGEDDGFMLQPEFVEGVAALHNHGLRYDILVFEKQLATVRALIDELPSMPLVIDHIAKPDIRNDSYADWAQHMTAIARHDNVWCKVSGMVTEADWNNWNRQTFERYLALVFEAFGERRVMFGSDWPVCTVAGDYARVVDIVADFVARNAPQAEASVFGAAARAFYGL